MSSNSAGVGGGLPPAETAQSGYILTTDGQIASWAAAGPDTGVTTVGTFGATPTANAATISGVSIFFQPADGTHPGSVTTGTQTFGGAKTFSGGVVASVTGNVTGDVTAAASAAETITTNIANGAGNVGLIVNNSATLTTAGSELVSFRNNGTVELEINNIGGIRGGAHTNIGGGTYTLDILGGVGGNAAYGALYLGLGATSVSTGNYVIASDASTIYFNCPTGTTISFAASGTTFGSWAAATLTQTNGNIEVGTVGNSFILKSPDGTRYKLVVANGGALSATAA